MNPGYHIMSSKATRNDKTAAVVVNSKIRDGSGMWNSFANVQEKTTVSIIVHWIEVFLQPEAIVKLLI